MGNAKPEGDGSSFSIIPQIHHSSLQAAGHSIKKGGLDRRGINPECWQATESNAIRIQHSSAFLLPEH